MGRGIAGFIPGFLLAAAVLGAPAESQAFCVANNAKVQIHAQSLSSKDFEADIKPKAQACCTAKTCVSKKTKKAQVLVVTGFVPVTKKKGRPGWKAECRAPVKMNEWVDVKGSKNKITCKVRKPIPKKWLKKWLNSQNEGMASSSPPRGRLLAMAGRRVR